MKEYYDLLIELFAAHFIENRASRQSLDFNDVELKRLINTSVSQKCFPLFYTTLKRYNVNKFNFLLDLHWRLNEKKVNKFFEQCMQFSNNNSINFSICKGFVLSQILYGTPYMRMFSDIDVYVSSDNLLPQCLQLEKLGYHCNQVELLKDRIKLEPEFIDMYYSTDGEKKFNRNVDEATVEVKDWGYYFSSHKIAESEHRGIIININDHTFNTFNLQDSFILCFENIHSNFFIPWGINKEHTLRDVLDITTFVIKYPELFTEEFLSVLEDENRLERLAEVIWLIQTVFAPYPELIKKIPKILLNRLPVLEETISREQLLERIFNSEKRIDEWKKLDYKSKILGDKKRFFALDLQKSCYDYQNGLIELTYQCVMDRIVNSSLHTPICFSLGYDDKNLIFSYCISKKYPHIQLHLSLLKENTIERYEDEIVMTLFKNGEIEKENHDVDFNVCLADCDDCFILSLAIKKEDVSIFKSEQFYEIYFSFKWFFLEGNMHNENYIATSTDGEQGTICFPLWQLM